MWNTRKVAIVVPAFNEGALIEKTLRAIPRYADAVYVVDDASTDDTARRVASVDDPRIRLVAHPKNLGVGAAIKTGYRQALTEHMDVMVVMAGDNQMNPSDLPRLLDAIESGADYAKGNRFIHPRRQDMPVLRRLGSGFLSWLTRCASGLQVDDSQCGYAALTAATARMLPLTDLWPRYGYPNDLLLMLAAYGSRVEDVAVQPVYASEKSGLHAGYVLRIAWLIWSRRDRHRLSASSPHRTTRASEPTRAPEQLS